MINSIPLPDGLVSWGLLSLEITELLYAVASGPETDAVAVVKACAEKPGAYPAPELLSAMLSLEKQKFPVSVIPADNGVSGDEHWAGSLTNLCQAC
jgi:hypothetical protein